MIRALFQAIRAGNLQKVRAALAAGADPNAQLKSGPTALTEALTHGHTDVVRALLEAEANVNTPDGDGYRPLDIALLYSGRAAVRLLIERGATVNYVRPDGDTGLMAAGGFGDVSLVELFLAAGANPDVPRAIDGLTVTDIQVMAIASADAPAGMRKSSKRILDTLAAAGATVRTMDQIQRLKEARWRAKASLQR